MGEKIVVADDEIDILHVLAVKLRKAGYEVLTASDGEEALELSLAERPDLIIAEYRMPCMNGLELSQEYSRIAGRQVPVMLITAWEFDVDKDLVASSSVEAVMEKPFSPREMLQTVRRILDARKYKTKAA